jgi:two-component system, chemotaxis family, sensor kinase CheA
MSTPDLNDPEIQEIFEGYLIETHEILDQLTPDLMTLEETPSDRELLNSIFRGFHTVKGTSAFMGFDAIVGITHHAEDILNKLRKDELQTNQEIIDVLLEVHDWITNLVEQLENGESTEVDYSDTIKEIERLKNSSNETQNKNGDSEIIETEEIEQGSEDPDYDISAVQKVLEKEDQFNTSGDLTEDEMSLLDDAFAEASVDFYSALLPPSTGEISDSVVEVESLQDSDVEVAEETPDNSTESAPKPKITPTKPSNIKAVKKTDTIRVDVNRVETLMDLSGELVLGRNRLAQLTEIIEREYDDKEKVRDLIEATAQVDFITSEIQAAVMRMRMVPIKKLYQKAPRIVRDLSKEFGKKIKLELKGEETEIDRGIIEELNDPLVHMIRNSCDHGIESKEDRKAAGKPELGHITLDADQEGNNIVMKIIDDGKGLDTEIIKEKAVEKGVITKDQADQMSKRDAYQLIFQPGFSTAKTVSSVSGRGVGMDVVRTNIQKLKGIIEVESEIGVGSTFIIKLPLTLAIIQGLLVKLKNETYAIPLSSVVSVVDVDMDNIYTINNQEVIRIREDVMPLIRMDKVLQADANEDMNNSYVVIVGLGIERYGLVVNELLGQQEIVIKSLGGYLGNIDSIAGSTILGDGRVIMIVDIAELVRGAGKATNLNGN